MSPYARGHTPARLTPHPAHSHRFPRAPGVRGSNLAGIPRNVILPPHLRGHPSPACTFYTPMYTCTYRRVHMHSHMHSHMHAHARTPRLHSGPQRPSIPAQRPLPAPPRALRADGFAPGCRRRSPLRDTIVPRTPREAPSGEKRGGPVGVAPRPALYPARRRVPGLTAGASDPAGRPGDTAPAAPTSSAATIFPRRRRQPRPLGPGSRLQDPRSQLRRRARP